MSTDEDVRKELSRLLSTAQEKERKDLIIKAMQTLDEQSEIVKDASNPEQYRMFHSMSPSTHAALFMAENMPVIETVTMTPGGSARIRPMSAARLRRPSMPSILDAIPEMGKKSNYLNPSEEIVMPYEDISEVIASSYDGRFPPKNIFKYSSISSNNSGIVVNGGSNTQGIGYCDISSGVHNLLNNNSNNNNSSSSSNLNLNTASAFMRKSSSRSPSPSSRRNSFNRDEADIKLQSINNNSNNNNTTLKKSPSASLLHSQNNNHGWVSTGLVPQFLYVSFFEKWYIKKIEVFCSGIEKLCFQIHTNATSALKSSGSLTEMIRLGNSAFVWDAGGKEDHFDQTVGGLQGIAITFIIKETSHIFIRISEIRILVLPYT